ncbi:NAD-dependent epimerase/dehydratase family protein [Dubosiella newyorkensis]|uniref:NAD-dependent epimerase/dehydratase family protein n=1 Tax=Dubosiella newyorkensis TaxID=1862672 RepID=UPI00255AC43E|nr:NAD-dependent epimerase/dehydratase family protein [Dubosiella newyorkensis]
MKRVLITGKHSYLGGQVKQYLEQFPDYEVEELDLHTNWKDFDFSNYDSIFHVAGLAHSTPKEEDRSLYYQINTDLAYEVAQKAKESGCKQFIFMSSIIVYGNQVETITSKTPLLPENFYGDSKRKAEEKIWPLNDENFRVCIVRPPMIYGPNSKGNYRLLSNFAKKIPLFPNVSNHRSMLFVGNFTAFIKGVIDHSSSGFFLPQNKEEVETRYLVKEIAKIHQRPMWISNIWNPLIQLFKNQVYIKKLFGNLVIDPSLSTFGFDYQIYTFQQSIAISEGGD